MSYRSVSLLDTKYNVITSISGPLSPDVAVGLITAWRTLSALQNKAYSWNIQMVDGSNQVTNIDLSVLPLVEDYVEYANIPRAELPQYSAPAGYNAWWIADTNGYTLYRFFGNDFIQGFISGCDILTSDFRDYTIGTPFYTKSSNLQKQNIFYDIEGYDIEPLIQIRREPAPVGAYYTHGYEQYDRTGLEPDLITDEIDSEYPRDFQ